MRAKHAIRKYQRWSSHSGDADTLAAEISDRIDLAVHRRLHPQTTAMNSSGEFYIEALFDRFKKIHHQVMRDIESPEREDIFIIRPFTFHQTDIESFLFEITVLDCAKDRRFAGNANISDADFVGRGG